MDTILKITLWDKDVAAVQWNSDTEIATIGFFNSFVKEGLDIAPLTMPLRDIFNGQTVFSFPAHRGKTFKGLPGLLSDSLPDDYGNSVIDEWFATKQMSVSVTPLDRLSYIGERGMGALEFKPVVEIEGLDESSNVEIEHLTKLAKQVLDSRKSFSTNLQKGDKRIVDMLKVGTSAGGAKPKAIIAFNEKTKEVRSGQVKAPDGFTYWLLKFDGVEGKKLKENPLGIGRIEYAYHKMALDCGINMTNCKLLHDGEYSHFMTKRFDRTDSGEKLHTQTLCAMAHYDRDERHSYEQIFLTMRQLYLPYPDFEQMFRRMVFNVIARNHDDHTKNHSFIMDRKGEWSLAPAYDLCYSYSPSGQWTSVHQLSLNGKRDNFTVKDLLDMAVKADVRKGKGKVIIEQVLDVVSQWKTYARKARVKREHVNLIQQALRLKL